MGKYVDFDQNGYLNAIKRSVHSELQGVVAEIHEKLVRALDAVTLRRVDMKYKSAMLDSINTAVYEIGNVLIADIGAGGEKNKRNQGFRAVYYEYGTGNLMQPPAGWSSSLSGNEWGSWNMARKGLDIYQRPRGTWYDLGGNPHVSKIKGEPKKLPNKPGSYGEEIRASHWFRDTLKESLPLIESAVRRAVKNVPISAYIRLRSITKRM